MGSKQQCVKFDEIKKMLKLPDLAGVQFSSSLFRDPWNKFRYTLPEISTPEFDPVREILTIFHENISYAKFEFCDHQTSIPAVLLRRSQPASGSGDNWGVNASSNLVLSESARPYIPKDTYVDLLSGYDEYLRDFCANGQIGVLRVTPQGTLSLSLGHSLQVDVSINGAIRIVNPKVNISLIYFENVGYFPRIFEKPFFLNAQKIKSMHILNNWKLRGR
jgi:hypothetical protein